jgi:hypothetical protein
MFMHGGTPALPRSLSRTADSLARFPGLVAGILAKGIRLGCGFLAEGSGAPQDFSTQFAALQPLPHVLNELLCLASDRNNLSRKAAYLPRALHQATALISSRRGPRTEWINLKIPYIGTAIAIHSFHDWHCLVCILRCRIRCRCLHKIEGC